MVIDDLNFKLEYGEGSEGESYLESTAHKGVQIISVWGHPEAKPDRETEGAREIARRLAACWNACAGISTESLESNDLVKGLAARHAAMRQAIKAAIECGMVPSSTAKNGGAAAHSRQAQVADMLRDAVKQAEGET